MALRATWTFFSRRLIIVHIDRSAECATVPNVEQQLCLHKGQVVGLRFDRNSEHVALNLWTEDREISAMENARGYGRAYLIFYGINGALWLHNSCEKNTKPYFKWRTSDGKKVFPYDWQSNGRLSLGLGSSCEEDRRERAGVRWSRQKEKKRVKGRKSEKKLRGSSVRTANCANNANACVSVSVYGMAANGTPPAAASSRARHYIASMAAFVIYSCNNLLGIAWGLYFAWRAAIRHRQRRHLPPHNDYLRSAARFSLSLLRRSAPPSPSQRAASPPSPTPHRCFTIRARRAGLQKSINNQEQPRVFGLIANTFDLCTPEFAYAT